MSAPVMANVFTPIEATKLERKYFRLSLTESAVLEESPPLTGYATTETVQT